MSIWGTIEPTTENGCRPTLFLDRDGVLIRDRDYLRDPAGVALLPGVAGALVQARSAGFQLIGVSNQSGLGRGYFSERDLDAVMRRVTSVLQAGGARLDGFFYCPHAPADKCNCRKPRPGLLAEAGAYFQWDPARSWVVGDKASDVRLGLESELGAVLVGTGYGRQQEAAVRQEWSHEVRLLYAEDLAAAVAAILARPEFAEPEVTP